MEELRALEEVDDELTRPEQVPSPVEPWMVKGPK